MSATRPFHLGDILSVTTGRLVSLRHLQGVYEITSYMVGRSVFTHELPSAAKECRPALLAQYPDLAEISVPELTPQNFRDWLDTQVARFGASLPVEPLTWSRLGEQDAMETALEIIGDGRVLVIDPTQQTEVES